MEKKKPLVTTLRLGIPLEGKWAKKFSPEEDETEEIITKSSKDPLKKRKGEDQSKIIQAEVKKLEEEAKAEMIRKKLEEQRMIQAEVKKLKKAKAEEEKRKKLLEKAKEKQKEWVANFLKKQAEEKEQRKKLLEEKTKAEVEERRKKGYSSGWL